MGIYQADGTRLTKATFPTAPVNDPEVTVTANIFATRPYGRGDGAPEGSIRTLLFQAGDVIRESDIDKLFPPATITTISPATGPADGGTVVTITGTGLDGVTAVNFGDTAGTGLRIDSAEQLRVTTPAGAAGAVDVSLVDDAGTVTETGGFTYA